MSRFTDLFQEVKTSPEVQEPVKTKETVSEKPSTVKKSVKAVATQTATAAAPKTLK